MIAMLLLAVPAYAQKKKVAAKTVPDTSAMRGAKFYGTLLDDEDSVVTVLQLDRRKNDNFGFFTLDEVTIKPGGRKFPPQASSGKWTTLKGSASDEDAAVIQLEGGDKLMFFLLQNDSTLQKLTATKEEIYATESYLLRRRETMVTAKKDTLSPVEMAMRRYSGKFVGKFPCSDCNSIVSTLTLKYSGRGKSGDYTLTDKYMGSKNGDITNERKGKWTYTAKQGGNIIIIDTDKRGRESYYLTNNNGTITPLDRNQQKIEGTADRTMRKQ